MMFGGEIKQPPTKECNDGNDNDGDGLIDLNDPGCIDENDDNETDETPPLNLTYFIQDTSKWVLPNWTSTGKLAINISLAREERENTQIAIRTNLPVTVTNVEITDLSGTTGVLESSNFKIYRSEDYNITTPYNPVQQTWTLGSNSYPDILIPKKDYHTGQTIINAENIAFPHIISSDGQAVVVLEFYAPNGNAAGTYTGNVTITTDAENHHDAQPKQDPKNKPPVK